MRRIIWGTVVGALAFGFTHNALVAVIGAVLGGAFIPQAPTTHRVMVENIQTGEVKIQPMDGATQAYLNTRKNISKEN